MTIHNLHTIATQFFKQEIKEISECSENRYEFIFEDDSFIIYTVVPAELLHNHLCNIELENDENEIITDLQQKADIFYELAEVAINSENVYFFIQ